MAGLGWQELVVVLFIGLFYLAIPITVIVLVIRGLRDISRSSAAILQTLEAIRAEGSGRRSG